MLKHLEPKTRFIITAAVFAAAIILLCFAILRYALPEIIRRSGDIEQAKTAIAVLEKKKNILLAEEEKLKSLSAHLDAVASAIVPANNPVTFFGILERMADSERLSLEINPVPTAQNAPPNAIAINLSVTGTMRQEIDFVKNIAILPFVITVSDITFSQNISIASAQASSRGKPITATAGETMLTMTLFAASRP